MKKFKKISYIILLVIIVVLSLTIYTSANKENEQDDKEKAFSEVKFLESKIIDLLNSMNNIEIRNYKVAYEEISKASDKGNSSSSKSENSSSNENTTSSGNTTSSDQNTTSNTTNSSAYELKRNGVLNSSDELDWDNIKGEAENLYESIPTITLDLYKINLNQEDILSFNKEFDNLTIAVKDENKKNTLDQLGKLYDYIPKFAQNATDDELYKKLAETKTNIFKAYSKLDSENWDEINDDINNAINVYSAILTDTNINSKKQYSINRVYIMLNELRNAVSLKDKSIFLIKYKNLVEEMDNM